MRSNCFICDRCKRAVPVRERRQLKMRKLWGGEWGFWHKAIDLCDSCYTEFDEGFMRNDQMARLKARKDRW